MAKVFINELHISAFFEGSTLCTVGVRCIYTNSLFRVNLTGRALSSEVLSWT